MDHEQALDEFERAWRDSQPLEIRELVAELDGDRSQPASRHQLVCELIMIDFWHRWRGAAGAASADVQCQTTTAGLDRSAATTDRLWPRLPRLDDYVRRYRDLLPRGELPVELIGEEYRVRRRFGDGPTHREYLLRFPRHSKALKTLLARIDEQISRHPLGDTLPTADAPAPNRGPPPKLEAAPASIGKYVVLAALDRGGQGRVFRAIHPDLRQELVIKLGHAEASANGSQQAALVAEARVLAQLDHPNLVRVHDLGFHENCPYAVLDYVPGRNLREIIRDQRLPALRSAEIVAKVARALAVLHARGITHRDLKPANILIDQRGEPRLIDFGLARERCALAPAEKADDTVAGTLLYMAPEQARGEGAKIGCRTDVYGLGAVFYELLVGAPPRQAAAMPEMLERVQSGEVNLAALDDPAIPPSLARICRQALSPRPEDRQSSAEVLEGQIERWRANQSQRGFRRLVGAVVAAAAVLGLAVGAALLASSAAARSSAKDRAIAARIVGHEPHHDYSLSIDVLGHDEQDGVVSVVEGEKIAIRLQSEQDSYVGVWHIDAATKEITQLFPNAEDQDHFLPARQALTVPGRDNYAIEVSPGAGPEYLWVAASSQPWDATLGRERGPAVVLAHGGGDGVSARRTAKVVSRSGPRLSEAMIRLEVKARAESAQ